MVRRNPSPRWVRDLSSGFLPFENIRDQLAHTVAVAIIKMSAKPSTSVKGVGDEFLGLELNTKRTS